MIFNLQATTSNQQLGEGLEPMHEAHTANSQPPLRLRQTSPQCEN